MENIKILGTGSASGIPHPYCGCESCRVIRNTKGKDVRKRSGVKLSETTLIEFSPDIRSHILDNHIDFNKVENIMITHTHNDHLDIQELIRIKRDINVYVNEQAVEWLKGELERGVKPKHRTKKHEILTHNIIPLNFFEPIKIGEYMATPIIANHTGLCDGERGMNFILKDGRKTLLYASDTGEYPKETMEYLKKCYLDKIIIECTFLKNIEKRNGHHLNVIKLKKLLDELMEAGSIDEKTEICITHFGHDGYMMHDEIEKEFDTWSYNIAVAYDGMDF